MKIQSNFFGAFALQPLTHDFSEDWRITVVCVSSKAFILREKYYIVYRISSLILASLMEHISCERVGVFGSSMWTIWCWRMRKKVKDNECRGEGTEDGWVCVPPPGQKRGLDWRFASKRPSNSAPQTPDCLFLAPVGVVKQGQGQSTSKSTSSGNIRPLPIQSVVIISKHTQIISLNLYVNIQVDI